MKSYTASARERLKLDHDLNRTRGIAPTRARNCSHRRQNAMRGVLTSITNIVGHARPRSPSISSSDSDVDDDGDDDLRPVGARIGHNFRKRPIYTTRFAFTYARATLDGGERAYEDIAAEQLRGTGVDPRVLVMRRSYCCERERCMRFKYVCADWRTCGCAYYVYVNFGAKG